MPERRSKLLTHRGELMSNLRAISLFTGAGGLDYGFEAAGFHTSVALELDRHCVETLKANRAWPVINKDIAAAQGEASLRVILKTFRVPFKTDVTVK